MTRVLVVATSRKTRGGITSVVKAHETGEQWKKYHCRWIETHRDGPAWRKLWYLMTALLEYVVLLPFYDIVHIHIAAVNRKIPFLFLALLFHKRIITHYHFPDPSTTLYNKRLFNRYKWCVLHSDICIVLSETWKQLFAKLFNTSNIRVIYNPCSDVERATFGVREKYILYAGTLSERKGYRDLIKAFSKCAIRHPDWKLVFAGNGEIDMARSLSKDYGITAKCEFLGWIVGERKKEAFQKASGYCLPSYGEGFPMGVLDAWAYGLPVITTPVGGLPDVLKDGKNALVFSPGDVDELAKRLDAIMESEQLRLSLSATSKKLADGLFNVININKQIEKLYDELYKEVNNDY